MLPEIAVLMPVYNPTSEEISRTLESIRVQDEPYHLYLVDDGSRNKPNYTGLLKQIPHTLIELPANRGITGALNAGLEAILAQPYKYIARIDCGDVALPERFAKQRRYLSANPGIAIVGTDTKDVHPHLETEFLDRQADDWKMLARKLQYNMPLSHPTLMIRTDVFRAIGLYSDEYDAAEDYELLRRADRAGYRLGNVPEILLLKIEDGNSISQKKRVRQMISRLRIQWKYLQPTNIHSLIGTCRTILQLALPASMVYRLKMIGKNLPPGSNAG
jgi:glycosyltransferase involved in cell wall biosynthesis